jgi:hypothetical protein
MNAMRKAILMMLQAVVSSSAAAEWVEVEHDDSRHSIYYKLRTELLLRIL